ncbi:hypothetical protein H072_6167 [Dactylellina haptotyla CBS 200.50]|uniref:Linalool dehydratase/isomerase domain-containing protein n=1 Tax=Dactylellina haptotyla (strain CBS 200.50) TaxID=1284197 RepID=S8AAU3_DACHA|nr:hypothetical protein H072_6167 [Dactylellina haptotyla CBS 200.50]
MYAAISSLASMISRVLGPTLASGNPFDDESYKNEFISELKEHTLQLADDIWKEFWDEDVDLFCNKRPSAETVPLGFYNGYTVWTFTIGLQAIIEAEKLSPGRYTDKIATATEILQERYYNTEFKAYSAWLHSKGDSDVYYDDNAQIAIAFVDTYLAFKEHKYLELARELCHFLITGWTESDSAPGGIQWHVGDEAPHTDRCCCSTAITGIALLRTVDALRSHIQVLKSRPTKSKIQLSDEEKQSDWVALEHASDEFIEEIEKDIQKFVDIATKCGKWLVDTLLITEKDRKGDALTHLIADKMTQSDDSYWKRDEHTILSYNIGSTIQLLCLLHNEANITQGSSPSLKGIDFAETIHILAATSITPYKAIFNTSAPNPAKRVWSDYPYFTHLLIEGLLVYTNTFPNHPKNKEVINMILHNVAYMKNHLSDAKNPLFYHRNLRLTHISPEKTTEWNETMGVMEKMSLDKTERVYDEPWEDTEGTTMARTLLANGGVARGFALTAGELGRKKALEEQTRRILTSASLVAGDW